MKRASATHLAMLTMGLVTALSDAHAAGRTGELWETQLTMKSAQHGEMAMPAQRICQPPAARDVRNLLPQMNEDCPGVQVRTQGDRVTWAGQCRQGRSEGEVRYVGADRIEGHMRMTTAQGEFAMNFKGRRLGPCTTETP
jgi:hypothetical protein